MPVSEGLFRITVDITWYSTLFKNFLKSFGSRYSVFVDY